MSALDVLNALGMALLALVLLTIDPRGPRCRTCGRLLDRCDLCEAGVCRRCGWHA